MAEHQAQQAEAGPINVNAQAVAIQPLPEFNPDCEVGASLGARCNLWIQDFEMFLTPNDKRTAIIPSRTSCRQIFRQIPETGDDSDYAAAKQNLKNISNHNKIVDTQCTNFDKLDKRKTKRLINFTRDYVLWPKHVRFRMLILKSNNK